MPYYSRDGWWGKQELEKAEKKEMLQKIRDTLQKMVHRVGCKEYKSCPRQCCRKGNDYMLDLDTAIAWEAQDAIGSFLDWSDNNDYERVIDALYNVVLQHKGRYIKLHRLLKDASRLTGEL